MTNDFEGVDIGMLKLFVLLYADESFHNGF